MIANRLKPLMVKLISPVQTSFVPGRKINENILIAQGQRRKERGIMAVKIDLQKAYDRLHWGISLKTHWRIKLASSSKGKSSKY